MQTQPIPCHLAPLTAIIANRPEAQQLPEVAGERQVEAEPSDKLAESLQLINSVQFEIRRHKPLHGD
jgi:hypothetical protein|tara:strand:- start:410 stop:610 length:201 start_codon:yes stop_codon:yes gene_type:complete